MKKKVFVLYGGKSAEHEVSLKSAMNVINELDKGRYEVYALFISQDGIWSEAVRIAGPIMSTQQLKLHTNGSISMSIGRFLTNSLYEDSVVFPVLHGTYGEDGTLQGMLEMLQITYVGNNVISSAIGMDKVVAKQIFEASGIPITPYVSFNKYDFEQNYPYWEDLIFTRIGFPCYIKPANMGSSIGISYCKNIDELKGSIQKALLFDEKVLVEKEIIGKEIIVGILGNEEPRVSLAGEWQRTQTFFDYEDKYLDPNLTPNIPAQIDDEVYELIKNYCKTAFKALNGSGLMRADFFVTEDNEIFLNEVNTLPGFTQYSMFPLLFNKTESLSYSQLLDELIELALSKHYSKQALVSRRAVDDNKTTI